jgi:hypothetical protein
MRRPSKGIQAVQQVSLVVGGYFRLGTMVASTRADDSSRAASTRPEPMRSNADAGPGQEDHEPPAAPAIEQAEPMSA